MTRQRRWQSANPKARWAHIALASAIRRGIVQRGPCEVCGAEKVDGHHPDYDRPAHVIWLCRKHHGALHREARRDG
jgi:hypothetical protein